MEHFRELGMMTHAEAVAADVDDVTVVQQAIDERGGHDLVAQDLAPLLEPFVGCEDSGRSLIAPVDELEEEHGTGLADRQVADLVDDQERGIGEDLEAASQLAGRLGFFERGDEVGQRTVVDSAPALGCRDGEADRQMRLADARRAEEDDIFLTLQEPELVERVDLFALDRGLEREVEVLEGLDSR